MSYSDELIPKTPEITKVELRNALAGWIKTGISLGVGDPFEVDAKNLGCRRVLFWPLDISSGTE